MKQQTKSSLVDDIVETLDLYGVPQSTFGAVVSSDPTLVWKMRVKNRVPGAELTAKINRALEDIRNGTWLKAGNAPS